MRPQPTVPCLSYALVLLIAVPACTYPAYHFQEGPGAPLDGASDDGTDASEDAALEGAQTDGADADVSVAPSDAASDAEAGPSGCRTTPDSCPGGQYCAAATGTCKTGCKTSAECNAMYDASVFTCDTTKHRCTGCRSDNDCPLGLVCGAGTECVAGCTATHGCDMGEACCSGTCFDLEFDVSHCGSCDMACDPMPANATSQCFNAVCRLSCDAFMQDCNHDASDGCEVDVRTDSQNCSVCGNPCTGDSSCVERACR